jgi:Right handed beta helix region
MTAWTRFSDRWQASGGREILDAGPTGPTGPTGPPPPGYTAAVAGATLPINDALPTLAAGTRYWYVAPATASPPGNDSNAGTLSAPKLTFRAAIEAVSDGDVIVLRGGKYPIPTIGSGMAANIAWVITNNSVTVTAQPGELPIFDGTQAAGTITTDTNPNLKKFAYLPMGAVTNGEGIDITTSGDAAFPAATFTGSTAGSATTGMAATRGFVTLTGGSPAYSYPSAQTKPSNTGTYVVSVGMFPDQCWVDGVALKQVLDKSLVQPGYFWSDRTTSDDASPSSGFMYIHKDQTDRGGNTFTQAQVAMSKSGGKFTALRITGNNVTIRGVKFYGHSPSLGHFTIDTSNAGVSNVRLENVMVDSCASISVKLYGDWDGAGVFGETNLVKNATLDRVTVSNTGWLGMSALYTTNTKVTHCLFEDINWAGEIDPSPKSGAIKCSKNQRMIIEYCIFRRITNHHGVWLDQSNYDCIFASNYLEKIPDGSPLFWEIGHKILVINNLFLVAGDNGDILRISGAGGARLVNNTVVGGNHQIFVVADKRGGSINGRTFSEHTERYGSGSIEADTSALKSDLDKARAGAYASPKPNKTPGLTWRTSAPLIINNVLASTSSSGVCMYFKPQTGLSDTAYQALTTEEKADILAKDIVPTTSAAFNGNVYQTVSGDIGQLQVRTSLGAAGNIPPTATLSVWKGSTGFGQSHYGGLAIEAAGLAGTTTWVVRATGKPTAALDAVQGGAAPVITDADINTYIAAGTKRYGSSMAPPGGW